MTIGVGGYMKIMVGVAGREVMEGEGEILVSVEEVIVEFRIVFARDGSVGAITVERGLA